MLPQAVTGGLVPSNKEHFGLSRRASAIRCSPAKDGPRAEAIKKIGGGKLLPDGGWGTLATGEFLLGYPDEAQEIPGAAMPIDFSRNGTFMAYRKLHENVASVRQPTWRRSGALLATSTGMESGGRPRDPQGEDGRALGRRRAARGCSRCRRAGKAFNRIRLAAAQQSERQGRLEEDRRGSSVSFTYGDDASGDCLPGHRPHAPRQHPRTALAPIRQAAARF